MSNESSRRSFFRQTLAAGPFTTYLFFDPGNAFGQEDCTLPKAPAATRFVPAEAKVVKRISAAEMGEKRNEDLLKNFRGAFGAVQALPPTDVISWTKQIAQHCINCAPSDGNNIHYNWQFLTWHRALLYFLERIMRKLSSSPGGDDLRLVYWDWENPNSRVLPTIYGPEGQPLYYAKRGDLNGPNWPLTDDLVDVQGALSAPDFPTFGGTQTQRKPVPITFTGPHANVHNNFDPGDMADLQYSPRDPVFYAHHSNIDRLWCSWVAAGNKNPDFGTAKVYFYDETRTWKYVLMNDLRDETKLGYKYSSLMKKESTGPVKLFTMSKSGVNQLAMKAPLWTELETRSTGKRYLIVQGIQNLEKLPEDTLRYGFFTKAPAPGTQATAENGYLGMAARVFSSGHNHVTPLSAALNVTGKLQANSALQLTVAPLDKTRKTTAAGIPLVADRVSLIG